MPPTQPCSDLYRQLVDASPMGIVVIQDGRIVLVNRTGATLLGRNQKEIVGLPVQALAGSNDRRLSRAGLSELRWKRVKLAHASGEEVVVEARLIPFTYDQRAAQVLLLRSPAEERMEGGEIAVQYKTLVEKLADVIFVLDLSGRFVFLNPGFARATGYACQDWIGRHFTEILAPEYVLSVQERFRAGPPPGGVAQYEIEVIGKDGERIPVELRVTALRDASGREIGRIGVARDVRERRRVEEELRRANAELNMILNTMGEGVLVLDAQHRMVRMNRKAHELFGYSHAELVGKKYTFWCHPESLPVVEKQLAARVAGKSATYEARFLRKGGESFYAQVTAVPIIGRDGKFQGSIGCLRDVTHERELLRQVEELSEFNQRLIELAGVWIDVEDQAGRVLVWNEEAERISGYPRAEVVGSAAVWERLYPNSADRAKLRKEQRQQAGRKSQCTEGTIRTRSGNELVICWHSRALRLSDGRAGWLVIGHDITHQRLRERRLREYAAVIERMNQERTQLLSMAAHELRTPLTVIRGFVELMARDVDLPLRHREWLEKINRQVARLSDLVTNLLHVARADITSDRLTSKRVIIGPLITGVLRAVEPLLADGKNRVSVDSCAEIAVYADPKAVEAVLLNLVTNAITYTPPPGKIAVRVHDRGDTVQIDVADEGIGISPADADKVFTEFYRTPQARMVNHAGSGIGLAVVKQLVERSGGRVWVRSPGEGKGSTFSFTLPKYKQGMNDARTDLRG